MLLACAQDGQRRPSVEAAADLLRGAARMWMRPRPGQPWTVCAAIRLMWAAALAELGVAVTILATLGSVRAAVLHAYPPAWHPVQEQLLVTAAEAPLVIGLWLWMAQANGKGRNRGRAVVFLVFNPASSRHCRTSMRNRSSLA